MIALASDHAGFSLKRALMSHLREKGIAFEDYGTYSEDSCDYPVFAQKAAQAVVSGECEKGILICGTGVGISIAANKVRGARAALCNDLFCARLSREHNDANILCMGARVVGEGLAFAIADTWLETAFDTANPRHGKRIGIIGEMER